MDSRRAGKGKRYIDLRTNTGLCLNFGFGTLLRANSGIEFRNSIVSIHNGVELLMKMYLVSKNKALVFQKIDYTHLLIDRSDVIKEAQNISSNTVNFEQCLSRLSHFSKLPEKYDVHLKMLNKIRNDCIHYEYHIDNQQIKTLLVLHIFEYVTLLFEELKLECDKFINERHLQSLNELKSMIDNRIKSNLHGKIEVAKSHYFDDLTQRERDEKVSTEDYTLGRYDKLVSCPACKNNALLKRQLQFTQDDSGIFTVIKRNLILKELACHYCALNITEYEELLLECKDEEEPLRDVRMLSECPDDCKRLPR